MGIESYLPFNFAWWLIRLLSIFAVAAMAAWMM